jgi:hypothetical protein
MRTPGALAERGGVRVRGVGDGSDLRAFDSLCTSHAFGRVSDRRVIELYAR